MQIPAAIVDLVRRVLGVQRAEALAAKNRLKSVILRDRAEVEAAARQASAAPVFSGEVIADEIPGEDRVRRARHFAPPPDDPIMGWYQLTHGATSGELRQALRIPDGPEDPDDGRHWIVVILEDRDRWYRSVFPHGLQTAEGQRHDRYLAIRAEAGSEGGQWRREE